jgi:phosphoesterase RecJ-like protein
MKTVTSEQIENFKNYISKYERFIIAGHKEPDGDCISSCLGVSYILDYFDKPYILINAGPFKRSEIKDFAEKFTDSLPFFTSQDVSTTGLIICDCSEISRLGEFDTDLKVFDQFIIDHHKTSSAEGNNTIIDPTAPAAACIVQQIYEGIIGKPKKEEAEVLFFGLGTDTGFFRFLDSTQANVFNSAARLVESGANPRELYSKMTGGKPFMTRKLLGLMLDRASLYCNGKLVVTYETMEDTKKYGQEGRDSDALYSLMLAVENVQAVLFVRQETEHNCTLGFRSKDICDVSAIAAKFGGGGHKNASGASTEGKIETIIPAIVKEFSKVL